MEYDMQKKRHPVWIAFLWFCFIAVVGIIFYLSFQDGEEAKAFGKRFIQYVAEEKTKGDTIGQEELQSLTYVIRQTGRVAIFFLMGILGTVSIHVSFRKWNWLIKTGIAAGILTMIAYLTEKLKIYIPSRHYSYEEMIYSIAAAGAGVILVSAISLMLCTFKRETC